MTHAPARDRLWSWDLVLASLAVLVLAFVLYLYMTTMALYAVDRFGASDTQGGLAAGVFIVGAVVARLFAGNVADLFGRRRTLIGAMVVFVVASLSYLPVDAAAAPFGVLLAVRAVHGAAFAFASTAAMALGQSLIPASRRAEGTGYFTLSATFATGAGPLLALVLVHGPGYGALFVAGAVAAVLGLVVALLVRTRDVRPGPDEAARLRRFHPRDMLHPQVLPVASFLLVLAMAYSGVLTFLNSFGEERGLQLGVGLFFLTYAVVLFLSRLVMGRVQDVRGDNVVVYVAVAAFAAGLALLGWATTTAALLVAGGLLGLGFGTLSSGLQAIAVGRVPASRVGVAVSTHFFMLDLGVGVGPVLLGLLLNRLGYDEMYLVLAVVVALSAGLYHLVHGRDEPDRRAARHPSPGTDPRPVSAPGT